VLSDISINVIARSTEDTHRPEKRVWVVVFMGGGSQCVSCNWTNLQHCVTKVSIVCAHASYYSGIANRYQKIAVRECGHCGIRPSHPNPLPPKTRPFQILLLSFNQPQNPKPHSGSAILITLLPSMTSLQTLSPALLIFSSQS
jgi:hypothetical protein